MYAVTKLAFTWVGWNRQRRKNRLRIGPSYENLKKWSDSPFLLSATCEQVLAEGGLLTCTCVGIHPGRVEPASPIVLTTSRTEVFQARRSCASSLDTFTQSFLHCAWPKTRGVESGSSWSVLIVAEGGLSIYIPRWASQS